ncbi:hypothetical protein [Chromobacterium vaccinii]|uniref:HK97 gp10 family phage protein n=1 Tax=Chromobacterium vaccinii TaxID=1108595 RepID=A0A1D9LC64_9NEIS|nr:hypothetical protein [Chromobacterium vaccinii]AOZ48876.1 hypothetical protein BKX93_01930 [Chromobacterium vaccinii]
MKGWVVVDDALVRKAFEAAPRAMAASMDRYVGRAGLYLAREAQRVLRKNRSIGFSTLAQSMHVSRPFPMARDVAAGVRYARYVEEGTPGGYRGLPPIRPLAEWLRIKHALAERDARRRAYGLARYIRDHGTQAQPFLEPAFNQSQSRLAELLREGAAAGVRAALGVRGHSAGVSSRYGA